MHILVKKEWFFMDYINAFWVGGLICALTQIPGRIMVLLVCSGAVLGAAGIYEPLLDYAKAGASVPLLGFGNVLWEGVHDAVQEEGLLGIFKGGLTAGSAGTCAALVFGYLASLVFDSKMKK